MKVKKSHDWDLKPSEARILQSNLAKRVIRKNTFSQIAYICGVDVNVVHGIASAACVVMSLPELKIVDCAVEKTSVIYPYIPGLLSFREIPALIPVLERIKVEPDILIADGQGIAHPRRLGLASHLGLLCNRPSIGCAKSKLIGMYREPGNRKGAWKILKDGDEIIGAVLRTRAAVKPVFVSIGHGMTLESAIDLTLQCCTKYRLTDPIRRAHQAAVRALSEPC
jgi:deoxyribonuclease V